MNIFFFKTEIFARGPPSLYKATSPSVDDQSLKKAPPVTARPVVPMLVRVAVLPCIAAQISLRVSVFFEYGLQFSSFSCS